MSSCLNITKVVTYTGLLNLLLIHMALLHLRQKEISQSINAHEISKKI